MGARPQTAANPATQAHNRSPTRPDDDARASGCYRRPGRLRRRAGAPCATLGALRSHASRDPC
eukprot:3538869-Alexandrium_andersonii.AAC.1